MCLGTCSSKCSSFYLQNVNASSYRSSPSILFVIILYHKIKNLFLVNKLYISVLWRKGNMAPLLTWHGIFVGRIRIFFPVDVGRQFLTELLLMFMGLLSSNHPCANMRGTHTEILGRSLEFYFSSFITF